MKGALAFAVIVGLAFYGGTEFSTNKIKASCDAEDAITTLKGTDYVCLTPDQMKAALQEVYNLGRQHGQKEL